ncbi:MAG: hypothetical protein JNL67_08045 [Planctomycetaceae bacterium]|nr:hypothetical protein [Planctomycetaceae bacterium]
MVFVSRLPRPVGLALGLTMAAFGFEATQNDLLHGQTLNGNRVSGVPIHQISPRPVGPPANIGRVPTATTPNDGVTVERPSYPQPASAAVTGEAVMSPAGMTDVTLPGYISPTVEVLAPASTNKQAQQEALSLIPWNELNADGRKKIKDIVDNPSMYRRLPVSRIHCDPQFYQFSIRNPETIVGLWQAFGVTSMGLQRTGPYTFAGDDGAGTDCTAELIYGDQERHIYVGSGTYEGPVFKRKVTGRCVAILKTDMTPGAQQYALTNQLDVFLRVDNLAADMIARTLQPMVGRTADHNFNESLLFLQAFSETAANDPQRVAHLVQQLSQVQPETKQQFKQVVATVPDRQKQYQTQR